MNENLRFEVVKPAMLEDYGFEYKGEFCDWTKGIVFGVDLYCQSPEHELWLDVDNNLYRGTIITDLPAVYNAIKELLDDGIIRVKRE